MERRSKMVLATSLGVTAVVVACSFPDVTFRTDDDDAGSEADTSLVDTGIADTGAVDEPDADVLDAGEPPPILEAGFPTEGGIVEDASECEGEDAGIRRCDCDQDGWIDENKKDCDAGPDSGLRGSDTLGWDCDDHDFDVKPKAEFKAVPRPDGNWDWDCNGKTEKSYPDGYKCVGGGALGCPTAVGFKENKACGEQGTTYRCVANTLLSCGDQVHEVSAIQQCR